MEFGKGNLSCDSGERIIATFDFSNDKEERNKENCVGEIKQSEFVFIDGFEEKLEEDIEQIELLVDEEKAMDDEKVLVIKENKESNSNNSFKDYIKICSEMGLIPSWIDFEKFIKFQ